MKYETITEQTLQDLLRIEQLAKQYKEAHEQTHLEMKSGSIQLPELKLQSVKARQALFDALR